MIPVTVMDEHNDAYYHWICYIEHKFIPPAGNYLLHIDHHDDFEFGGYDWDLNKMPDTPKDALDFVDRALGIADFIAPTLWQGIFSTVHIMKNLVPRPLEAAEEFVRLLGSSMRRKSVRKQRTTGSIQIYPEASAQRTEYRGTTFRVR